MANIAIGKQLQLGKKVASLDAKYGPYASREAAYDALGPENMDVIAQGLTVGIIENGEIVEYWWQGGTSLSNLVKKVPDVYVDVKNLVKNSVIDARANRCSFTYNKVPVFSVPCIYDDANCTLVHALLIDEGLIVDKLYLFAGRTLIEVYDADNKPDWAINFLPSEIASKLEDLDNSLRWE